MPRPGVVNTVRPSPDRNHSGHRSHRSEHHSKDHQHRSNSRQCAANIGLAETSAGRTAIASIPGIGWLLAGIAGLVALHKGLTKETREAKKQQKELNQAVAEIAAKPWRHSAAIQGYSKLGDDLKAKEKFIDENRINSISSASPLIALRTPRTSDRKQESLYREPDHEGQSMAATGSQLRNTRRHRKDHERTGAEQIPRHRSESRQNF